MLGFDGVDAAWMDENMIDIADRATDIVHNPCTFSLKRLQRLSNDPLTMPARHNPAHPTVSGNHRDGQYKHSKDKTSTGQPQAVFLNIGRNHQSGRQSDRDTEGPKPTRKLDKYPLALVVEPLPRLA
jgi:hypothetical protein